MVDKKWPFSWTCVVGEAVRNHRKARGWSAQALADECAKVGMPMQRTAISKLENGSRESITVGELFVLARALSVPPLLLLCPVDHLETLEILPGYEAESWEAARWVIGDMADIAGRARNTIALMRQILDYYYREFDVSS